ncbi:MAG: bis(5'-nucleosyl)-tetraphosphatase (symmetrical) YqeK [Endomicrobium sp.]|jgi:predicted HD superfamily hydrolase involved in NAD metabolism|nr:bis(5'-nucleosyl)-tetraphosphatase (symmetrical) YqeK [Endomicrobium sp.]
MKKILIYLFSNLTYTRLLHSIQVANFAEIIAYNNNVDTSKAYLAGILHDCAKCMSNSQLINFQKTYKFKKFNKCTNLLHSFVGSIIAKDKLEIQDQDVLNSIKYHTQGRKNMSVCEKIIFVSDYIAHKQNKGEIIKLLTSATHNLNITFFNVLMNKIQYILKKHIYLFPQIVDTWNWYIENNKYNKNC